MSVKKVNKTTGATTKVAGLVNSEKVNTMYGAFPSDASASNKLVSDATADEKISDAIADKTDKVSSATNGNFAGLDANGNLTDSGNKASDFQTALTFDNAPTENSNNPVKSGGIYADEKSIFEIMGKMGAKNLFPTNATYYNGRSFTHNGITFVENSDGSITASGIATADAQYTLFTRNADWGINIEVGQSYILSGCPSGGSDDTFRLVFGDTQSGAYHRLALDRGEGAEFTITTASEGYYASSIDVRSGVDLTTPITFYPMLRLASDTDSTYQPFAMTNQQMTPYVQAISNPNLLDNPWFTVNQRGQSSYVVVTGSNVVTVDRWHKFGGTVNVVDSGVELSTSDSSADGNFYSEYLLSEMEYNHLLGKTVTLSIKIGDNVYSKSAIMPSSLTSGWKTVITITCPNSVRAMLVLSPSSTNRLQIAIHVPKDGNTYIIRAVKLELGSVSTLAMDTAPNYASELLKCQRYFYRMKSNSSSGALGIGYGWTIGTTACRACVMLPTKMRIAPTFTLNDLNKFRWITNGSAYIPVTCDVILSDDMQHITIRETGLSDLTDNTHCILRGDIGGIINFSADL